MREEGFRLQRFLTQPLMSREMGRVLCDRLRHRRLRESVCYFARTRLEEKRKREEGP